MASISKDRRKNGKVHYRLQFYDKDKSRRAIRLGAISKKAADTIRVRIEDLVSAAISGTSPSNETAQWLATLGTDMYEKLTNAGFGDFVPRCESSTLGAFTKAFIEGRKVDSADSTIANFKQLQTKLITFFGSDRDLRSISDGEADDWRRWLVEGHAEATISKHVKRARQLFKAAMRKGLVDRNPFTEVRSGSEQNDGRKYFVDRSTTAKILDSCPNVEWRLIVALARYGGVRNPSETLGIRRHDIDWENERFTVTSPKTKKQGKPWRVVPLFPELRQIMAEAFEQAPDGAEYLITRYRNPKANLRTPFLRILKKAGIAPWPRLFQNLRASRETELANQFPLHVVTDWLGNTPAVANKHYLQTIEEHFERAIEGGATVGSLNCEVAQKPVLSASANGCQEMTEVTKVTRVAPNMAVFLEEYANCSVPPQGLEP